MLSSYRLSDYFGEKGCLKLKSMELIGFQSIGGNGVKIPLNKISVLVGPNSAGKSAVVDALNHFIEFVEYDSFINGLKKDFRVTNGSVAIEFTTREITSKLGAESQTRLFEFSNSFVGKDLVIRIGPKIFSLNINGRVASPRYSRHSIALH